jgi:hypothetical protein
MFDTENLIYLMKVLCSLLLKCENKSKIFTDADYFRLFPSENAEALNHQISSPSYLCQKQKQTIILFLFVATKVI